jgi:hypothetical protein
MQRLIPVLALWLLCFGAHAQTLYKCRVNGTVTYSGAPCEGAPSTALTVPEAPTPDAGAADALKRQQAQAGKLEKERLVREAAEERRDQAAGRLAASRRERCKKLALESKWANEAANSAAGLDKQQLIEKARRMRESLSVSCPG